MNTNKTLRPSPALSCFILLILLQTLALQIEAQESDLLESLPSLTEHISPNTAEATTETAPIISTFSETLKLRGEHKLFGLLPFSDEGFIGPNTFTLENQIQLSFDPGKGLALAAGLDIFSSIKRTGLSSELKHEFHLNETYIGLYDLKGIWNLYIGWQTFSWGTADKISPIDILNSRDMRFSLPSRQRKLPVLGAEFQLQPTPWLGLELIYLPFYKDNQIDVVSNLNSRLPKGSKTEFEQTELDFREPTLGGRIKFRLPNWDIGLSYIFAPDAALSPQPQTRLDANLLSPRDQRYMLNTLKLKREQLHHWGLDLRLAFDQLNFWLDTAFSLNTDWQPGSYEVRSPKLSGVLGAELSYGPEQKFYANFQYNINWLPDYRVEHPEPNAASWNNTDWQNYYLYQFNDLLAGYRAGLLQRFVLHLAFPFTVSPSGTRPINFSPELNLAYDLPLLYRERNESGHQLYINPELEISWDWQTNQTHSLRWGIAMGLEWFAQLEKDAENYYKDQMYVELRLLW